MTAAGVQTGIHYPIPVHLQDAYRDLRYPEGSFPVSEAVAREVLSLPMFPELTRAQIGQVGEAVRASVSVADGSGPGSRN
jgi:dTDP-4-amino-4,6-dideoxygalactose transaminase